MLIAPKNIEENIWETHSHLLVLEEFKKFKKEVKGIKKSSGLLKALFYLYDPKSPYANSGRGQEELQEELRLSLKLPNTIDFPAEKDKYPFIINMNKGDAELRLSGIADSLDKMKAAIDLCALDDADAIVKYGKALDAYQKQFDRFLVVREEVLAAQKTGGALEGNYTKSLVESGDYSKYL